MDFLASGMMMQQLFWIVVLCVAVAQGLFLAIALWTLDRGQRRCNRVLAGLLGFFTLTVIEYALAGTNTLDDLPHLTGISYGYIFLCGPALYLYMREHLFADRGIGRRDSWHLLPFGCLMGFYQLPFLLWSGAEKAVYVREQLQSGLYYYEGPHIVLTILGVIHLGIYLIAFLRWSPELHRDEDAGKHKALAQRWYQTLALLFGGFVALRMGYLFLIVSGAAYQTFTSYAMPLGMTAFIYGIGFVGFRHPQVFGEIVIVAPPSDTTATPPCVAYANSPLDEVSLRHLASCLEAHMQTARPYLNASLAVSDLAEALGVPPRQVSQVLNQVLDEHFFDYVNRYRVRAAQRLLSDPNHAEATILYILYEVGFNSKSTFNRVFKQHTGQTPSAYRRASNVVPDAE
jgi:AraC-like DNA-binding protein